MTQAGEARREAKATHVYVGTKPGCGCAVALSVDMPGKEKATGQLVSEFIADGLLVERVSVEAGAALLKMCPHIHGVMDGRPGWWTLEVRA